eukprot:Partr_v1_DN28487_c0_g2_i1_m42049 putative sphingolipid
MAPNTTSAHGAGTKKGQDFDVFTGDAACITAVKRASENEHDFIWSLKEEPHFSRRKAILKAHPEIQKLFGYEPLTKYIIFGICAVQFATAWYFSAADSYKSWAFWIAAYLIGGTCNQALFLGIHELSHNLGFKTIKANKLFSILVANVPIGFPYAASFKPYHTDHHKYQGVEGIDTDLPTELEAKLFSSLPGKIFFAVFQVLFYALRPIMTIYQPLTWYHLLNVVYIFAVDFVLFKTMGAGAVAYFIASTLMAGSGLHPCASHFIAEHYVFSGDWETYSYYGILNFFCFNVGYHNEHHDFPNIAWSKLPALRQIASEYYANLPYHKSWPMVTWKFVTDPNVTVWNRVKRKPKNQTVHKDDIGVFDQETSKTVKEE